MKIEIKNQFYIPTSIKPLSDFFQSLSETTNFIYCGLIVKIDPTLDYRGNDALIRWHDINEGFCDKLIVTSLEEFNRNFKLFNA